MLCLVTLYPIETLKIFDTEWFNKLTNIIEKQKEIKRVKLEERALYLKSLTDCSGVKSTFDLVKNDTFDLVKLVFNKAARFV